MRQQQQRCIVVVDDDDDTPRYDPGYYEAAMSHFATDCRGIGPVTKFGKENQKFNCVSTRSRGASDGNVWHCDSVGRAIISGVGDKFGIGDYSVE